MLRSLRQAVYAPDNSGHFGLALKAYGHFTSPIRRYPDLLVHRAIRHLLRGGIPDNFAYTHGDMALLGEHCSLTERRADEATRDTIDWLKCEYMQDKLGETFAGRISSVTSFGLFVELDEIFVEGLVHVTSLSSDYYTFDPVHHRMTGERSGRSYRLGDPITVVVARVDLDDKKIDFQPADVPDTEQQGDRKKKPRSKKRKGGHRDRSRDKESKGKGQAKPKTKGGKRKRR
jgi:ribonuclease R